MRSLLPFAFLCTGLPLWLGAQDCTIPFTLPLFQVQQEADLVYGSAPLYNGGSTELALNLFKPVGDGQTERPLVIVIHGGGLFAGHRNEMNDLCQGLAANGWAAATISYRLGFYGNGLFEPPYTYDPAEIHRALFRAMQDAKGAIRFLKGRHAQDSTSTTNVFLVGFSAGALTALQAGYMTGPAQKPAACGAIGDVQHFLNFYPRPDLGEVDGPLNQNGHDASVLGVASFFGAIADTAWITAAGPALYTYHQTGDPLVGCGVQRPYWGIGLGVPDNWPWLAGSCTIDARMQHVGPAPGRYLFHSHTGNAHDIHDPVGVLLEASGWMRDLFCGLTTAVDAEREHAHCTVYPNPTSGLLHVLVPPGTSPRYALHDAQGRQVRSGWLTGAPLDLRGLPAGMYALRMGAGAATEVLRVVLLAE